MEYREQVLRFLQGETSPLDGDGGAIYGFVLVTELVTPSGERGLARLTSDAGGSPLPWYAIGGLLNGAMQLRGDFDESL